MVNIFKICQALVDPHNNGQVVDSWWIDTAIVAIVNHFIGWDIDRRCWNLSLNTIVNKALPYRGARPLGFPSEDDSTLQCP